MDISMLCLGVPGFEPVTFSVLSRCSAVILQLIQLRLTTVINIFNVICLSVLMNTVKMPIRKDSVSWFLQGILVA